MPKYNSIVPLPDPLKKVLQQNFESKYKFASGISWEIVWQDWCRELETDPPTPPTVRSILFSNKNACEYRIADGLCQLLCKRSYDDWIDQLREELEKTLSIPDTKREITSTTTNENKEPQPSYPLDTSITTIKWEIRLEADEALADAIFSLVKQYSGDASLTLRRISSGSLVLELEGSKTGFEKIQSLYHSGKLAVLLGIPVLGVQKRTLSEPINLTSWFDNVFEAGWQAAQDLLASATLTPAFWGASVKGAKLIDLKVNLVQCRVILVISLLREEELEVSVRLQVYPQEANLYLPADLQLQVISDGEIFQEVVSRSQDQFIQCQFAANSGDRFTVSLGLGDTRVKENFVI